MRLIIKAKARPIGSVSPDGKYKKASSGEWLPIKKERVAGGMLENKIKEAYDWIFSKTDNNFEAVVLLDENGKLLKTRIGNRTSVDLSDLIYTAQGSILLHNHPSDASFSDDDIWFALTNDVKEIRAVGEKYEYVFRPKKALPKSKSNKEKRIAVHVFFSDAYETCFDKYKPKVEAGEMSAKEANMHHWHDTATCFVKEFGGFYERRER